MSDSASLGAAVSRLIGEPKLRAAMAAAAEARVNELSGAIQRTTDALEPLIINAQLGRAG